MEELLAGKRVELPVYNFVKGEREYKGDFLQLGAEDILVIEGIHCLNDDLSYSLPRDKKFKIYISALTQLNIDDHNRVPTTDGRLIRRMVRDARTRGASAQDTIRMWDSVRRGEERNIFPYQEEADAMFNSAFYMSFRCSNSMRSRSYIVFRVIQRSTTRRSGCSNFSIIFWVSAANRCRTIRLCANLSAEAVLKYD